MCGQQDSETEVGKDGPQEQELGAEVFWLDEEARKRCISLVPALTITSIHQRYNHYHYKKTKKKKNT